MKTFTVPKKIKDLVGLKQKLSDAGFVVINVGSGKSLTHVYLSAGEKKDPRRILEAWTDAAPPLIPKVFHRIWLGPKPLPDRFRKFGESWKECHPTWDLKLWTDENRPKLRHEDKYWATTNWSNRSNLLRYELILDQGGVYIDTDFECFRPIDALIEGLDFFTACEHYPEGWIAPGLFGAAPGHPLVREIVEAIPMNTEPVSYEKYCATEFFTSIVKKHPEAKVFPPELFYPYYCNETYPGRDKFPEAYAAHHWAMSWLSNSL